MIENDFLREAPAGDSPNGCVRPGFLLPDPLYWFTVSPAAVADFPLGSPFFVPINVMCGLAASLGR